MLKSKKKKAKKEDKQEAKTQAPAQQQRLGGCPPIGHRPGD